MEIKNKLAVNRVEVRTIMGKRRGRAKSRNMYKVHMDKVDGLGSKGRGEEGLNVGGGGQGKGE